MSDTKKLTRAEACATLAKRLGWTETAISRPPETLPMRVGECERYHPATSWQTPAGFPRSNPPDFFTSRNSVTELVAFMRQQDDRENFIQRLLWRVFEKGDLDRDYGLLLATPEQISLAACASLGIEVK